MTLLKADQSVLERAFVGSPPPMCGAGVELTIGKIIDPEGKIIQGPYVLQPNEMVQVVSAECFNLPSDLTALVTYKTGLTSKGIWALTVGIVDPGWQAPISTTLLNFSNQGFPLSEGDAFLRVILLEHGAVGDGHLRGSPTVGRYIQDVQGKAATLFPQHFLDVENVATRAGTKVMEVVQNKAMIWITFAAVIFTLIQVCIAVAPSTLGEWRAVNTLQSELDILNRQIEALTLKINAMK